VAFATTPNWVEGSGEKGEGRIEGEYLNRALDMFSGYMAADDEVSDGPFCVLSIVDSPACLKTMCSVLSQEDLEQCKVCDTEFSWHQPPASIARGAVSILTGPSTRRRSQLFEANDGHGSPPA